MNRNAQCEIKENGRWQLVAVNEALELDAAELKRCPTCHGRVRLHPKGGVTPAHFEHREEIFLAFFEIPLLPFHHPSVLPRPSGPLDGKNRESLPRYRYTPIWTVVSQAIFIKSLKL
jgi:hypothetical protein